MPTHQQIVEYVLGQFPDLTAHGFGVYEDPRRTRRERQMYRERERLELFEKDSERQLRDVLDFLALCAPTLRARVGSYHLKHVVERWLRSQDREESCYISNGVFILGAVEAGFTVRREGWPSPNARVGISARSLYQFDAWRKRTPETGPRLARAQGR